MWRRGTHLLSAFLLALVVLVSSATGLGRGDRYRRAADRSAKVSSYLKDEISFLKSNRDYDYDVPVIVRFKAGASRTASRSLGDRLGKARRLASVNGYSARLNADQLDALLASEDVEQISIDALISASADKIESDAQPGNEYLTAINADWSNKQGYDGSGVTVAVFDSGIYPHPDLDYGNKILFSVDFTSGEAVLTGGNEDEFGHGTHVAGLIAGDGRSSGGLYRGVAPGASLIDVKVLDENGEGRVSDLIAAIEWITENREELDVTVANFSVGAPAFEPYYEDPLCDAVELLALSGVAVVAAGGNMGELEGYPEVWGSITTPGTSPFAITVYPIDHQGTARLKDDTATSYGSRGPSLDTDLLKPDLSAPGDSIPGLLAVGSFFEAAAPDFARIGDDYVSLSGSSMAAPLVSGVAALLLEHDPQLSPLGTKVVLLHSANENMDIHELEQGFGTVDSKHSLKLDAHLLDSIEKNEDLEDFGTGEELAEAASILWGSRSGSSSILWGNKSGSSSVLWGKVRASSILWGNKSGSSSVLWGKARGSSILWGNKR